MDEAFERLCSYSLNDNVALTSLAPSLVAGATNIGDVASRHVRRRQEMRSPDSATSEPHH
jgi:hypothetical protein